MSLRVVRGMENWRADAAAGARGTALAIGNFDGVHAGHQAILRRVTEWARQTGARGAAVTFDPHPLKILRPQHAPAILSTQEQRLAWMEELGLEAVLVLPFTLELAAVRAEEFVEVVLAGVLRARRIFVGDNFRFGHRHAGDVRLLQSLAGRFGYEVDVVPPVEVDGEAVSSTSVRRAVSEGRMDAAARLLGRPFSLTGRVVRGEGRGSREVVPTLNLAQEQEVLPAHGVYATETRMGGAWRQSVTNVGLRPTFDGGPVTVETNLLDTSGGVSAGQIEVRFWKRLRGEIKFGSAEELKEQIGRDVRGVREFFAGLNRAQGTGRAV
ncbi:MAG TPA: bifunctional riboflavin kinase/FAD synthetase [Candidatus Acidoferrales bacterium]|nr:bifunctional riboflavin kinase/FAD synthetase [Candidatus Acidoferrales bacterium]